MHSEDNITESEKLIESVRLLNRHFELTDRNSLPVTLNMAEIRHQLERVIRWLLDNDMERLLQIMYRIDVSEKAFRQVLATSPPGDLSEEIAELVLKREWLKAETRLKYR